MNYLIALALVVGGVCVIRYTVPIVKLIGRMDWAERWLGPTGTFTAWKLIGLACIVAAGVMITRG